MRSCARTLGGVLTILLCWATSGSADPIVAGQWVTTRSGGSLSITGEHFSIDSGLDTINGPYAPAQCLLCAPGLVLDIGGEWSDRDTRGTTVVYRGVTYTSVGSDAHPRFGRILFDFRGSLIVPALIGTEASPTVPFTFSGFFRHTLDPTNPVNLSFTGFGNATLRFGRLEGSPGWTFIGAQYIFANTTPVPEPSTLLLCAAGAIVACSRRRRRARYAQRR
jgi:hypothetical protein